MGGLGLFFVAATMIVGSLGQQVAMVSIVHNAGTFGPDQIAASFTVDFETFTLVNGTGCAFCLGVTFSSHFQRWFLVGTQSEGRGGSISSSIDGRTFAQIAEPAFGVGACVAANDEMILVGSSNYYTLLYSTDGTTFVGLKLTVPIDQVIGLAFGPRGWVGVGQYKNSAALIRSDDGLSWTAVSRYQSNYLGFSSNSVYYSQLSSLYLAAGYGAPAFSWLNSAFSSDSKSWTGSLAYFEHTFWTAFADAFGSVFASSHAGPLYSSQDGMSWTPRTPGQWDGKVHVRSLGWSNKTQTLYGVGDIQGSGTSQTYFAGFTKNGLVWQSSKVLGLPAASASSFLQIAIRQ